jgi:hypothetical protein
MIPKTHTSEESALPRLVADTRKEIRFERVMDS